MIYLGRADFPLVTKVRHALRPLRPLALYAPSGAPRGQGAKGGRRRTPRVHTQGAPEGVPEGVRAGRFAVSLRLHAA